MSAETQEWLNGGNILVGNVATNGRPWWADDNLLADPSPLYDGPIPVEDVLSRLFAFDVVERPLYIPGPNFTIVPVPNRKAMVASDNGDVFGIFSGDASTDKGYRGHCYRDWLVNNVANILDDTLSIVSAGLLKNRAVAWTSVGVPDSITTPEGVEFRPNLLATTSFDGSTATTYKRVVQLVVCDNTLAQGLSEDGQVFRTKHTRNSQLKLATARDALAVVHGIGDEFSKEVARLCEWEVSDSEFSQLLDLTTPIPAEQGRGQTMATTKQDSLKRLYNSDPRVATWHGTAFGVLQAFNTYNTHEATVRNAHRVERQFMSAIDGTIADADSSVLKVLAGIAN
jgi:phage/plasmid-like protein (TIGR03299 family)